MDELAFLEMYADQLAVYAAANGYGFKRGDGSQPVEINRHVAPPGYGRHHRERPRPAPHRRGCSFDCHWRIREHQVGNPREHDDDQEPHPPPRARRTLGLDAPWRPVPYGRAGGPPCGGGGEVSRTSVSSSFMFAGTCVRRHGNARHVDRVQSLTIRATPTLVAKDNYS